LDDEGFRRTGNPQLEFFRLTEPIETEAYATIPNRIVEYIENRDDRFWSDHYQSRSILWDIVEFCRIDNFYDDNSTLYHVLMQTLMVVHSESKHPRLEAFKQYVN
jgi:hypothetical protein